MYIIYHNLDYHLYLRTPRSGDLHLAKPCLWQDGSAEQGKGGGKKGTGRGVDGGSRPTHVSQQERKKPGVATVSLYSQAHQVNS